MSEGRLSVQGMVYERLGEILEVLKRIEKQGKPKKTTKKKTTSKKDSK
jgi:hypothetical protein